MNPVVEGYNGLRNHVLRRCGDEPPHYLTHVHFSAFAFCGMLVTMKIQQLFLFGFLGLVLVLASCAREGVDYPSHAQYQRVVNALDGQRINEGKIISEFGRQGVRPPDNKRTGQNSISAFGATFYGTALSWGSLAHPYYVLVSFGYSDRKPFRADDKASENAHSYRRIN